MIDIVGKLRGLEVAWFGAAAAVAAAGAALFPGARVKAGLLGGASVLALGVWRAGKSCCAGCAGDTAAVAPSAADAQGSDAGPLDFTAMFKGAGLVGAGGGSCS